MILIILPLLCWTELCVGFFWGIPTVIHPSHEDVSEAYNLTSWISNQTSREILRQYITICPGQDMCHGDIFIRKYAFDVDMVSACTPCDCDDSCVRKSTCCPSKFLRIENSSTTNEKMQENHNLNLPPLACVKTLWNMSMFDVQGYWLIKSCPNRDTCDRQNTDLISSTPVTSIFTNESYLNVKCALCNNESAANLIFWKQNQILCNDRASLLMKKSHGNFSEMVSHLFPECDVLFYPPSSLTQLIKPCTIVPTNRFPCNYSGALSNERSYLQHACDSYYLPYSDCLLKVKNVFCALCNTDSVLNLPTQCMKDSDSWTHFIPMFSALMNFEEDKGTVVVADDLSCGVDEVYDTRLNECLDVTCEAEYVLERNLECRPMYPEWGENNYEVNMIFRPTHDVNKTQLSGIPHHLSDFLENRTIHNNITKYLCSIRIFQIFDNEGMYFGGLIELTVNHGHDIDKMIDKFIHIFRIDHDIAFVTPYSDYDVNISSTIIGQRFFMHVNNREMSYTRHYIHPLSFKLITLSSESDFSHIRKFCNKLSTTILVTEWYRCPKVKITTVDAKLGLKNYSLCLVDHDHCIPSGYFKRSLDSLQFNVCVDWYFRTTQVYSHQTSSDDVVSSYLSLVCLSLSSVGSMMTIISYLMKTERVNAPETNIIILSVFMIIANTIYTFSTFFQWDETLCVIVGMLVHFFWLSVVFWMSLCSFKVFETFTKFAVVKLGQTSDVCCRLVINLLLCLSFVGINIIVSLIESDGQSLGYSPSTCYIEKSKMILYTFTLPVGVTVCINMFMFVVTVCRIHDKGDVRKSRDQANVSAYFRLSTLTGMSWLFGFLAQFTNLQVFSFFHTVFGAGQGIFLYLAFGKHQIVSCKCAKGRSLEK